PVKVGKPTDAPADLTYTQVSAGGFHSLVVDSDGNAWAWGENGNGQLGDGTETRRTTPAKVGKPTDAPADFTYAQVSAGRFYSLALGSDGNAYACGWNDNGQIGDGTTTDRSTPVKVGKPTDAPADLTYTQVSAGGFHSLVVDSDGNAWAWGENGNGQLGDGTETRRTTPAKVGKPTDAPADFTYAQVSAGRFYSLALGSDGNAYACGWNDNGQIGDGTTTDRSTPVKVGKPTDAPADLTYTQVSAGGFHSLVVDSDGNAWAWGENGNGQLGDGTETRRTTPAKVGKPTDAPADFTYAQVSAGRFYSLALGSDGNAYACGWNDNGQIGDGTTTDRSTPVKVGKPTDAPADLTYTQVSAGGFHSLVVDSDGNAWAWGENGNGQLGDGTETRRTTPAKVGKPTDAPADFTYAQVSAGRFYSLALGSDGNAYACGWNDNGQIGDGTTTDRSTPVKVGKPTDAPADLTYTQVSAGNDHSLAVGSDGNAWAWGCNQDGPLGNNTASWYGDVNPVPARVRDPANPTDKSIGLKATQVSGGFHHSLALGSDGNAYAWGWNDNGQLGDGTTNTKSAPVPVALNLQLVITGVRFDQTPVSGLTRGDGSSVTVTTPAHQPGMVTISVDYTLGGAPQKPDTSLRYTYLPAGVLPKAGEEGVLLALATGMTSMGGVLASRRHRREQRQLLHASHE
ncbi:RCC1 domain-containing protein, partial [Bifidobacterium sp. wkB344]|uniref:RCC1 domain-containing protein n=1 Tax=Bifidobacterium sp. wkB344 TaxID=2025113 RepID=UPI0037BF3603